MGEITPVHVYTSGDAVELFLNGKSLGRREKEHAYDRLIWDDVRYEPGVLKAVAYKNGHKWAEEVVETTGKPAALQLMPEKTVLKGDGTDLFFVRVAVVDSKGRVVSRSKNYLKFSASYSTLLPFQGVDNCEVLSCPGRRYAISLAINLLGFQPVYTVLAKLELIIDRWQLIDDK